MIPHFRIFKHKSGKLSITTGDSITVEEYGGENPPVEIIETDEKGLEEFQKNPEKFELKKNKGKIEFKKK